MKNKSAKKPVLKLAVQELNWKLIPKNTKKIFFQFDLQVTGNGTKKLSLVAYPAYKSSGKWVIGNKIPMQNKKGAKMKELKLPLTLGNLELDCSDLKSWSLSGKSKLVFMPKLYRKNPHAEYIVTDDVTQSMVSAKPSPPASPLEA